MISTICLWPNQQVKQKENILFQEKKYMERGSSIQPRTIDMGCRYR